MPQILLILSLASVLASIIKLGSDNILVSRLRSTRNFAFHSKLTLYASSYFIISFILSLLSVFATFFVPYIYSIPSFSICLVSFGLVLLSYTSNFLITCNRLFLGLFIKPAPILISLYIVHFFTDSLQLTASISFLIPLVSFFLFCAG